MEKRKKKEKGVAGCWCVVQINGVDCWGGGGELHVAKGGGRRKQKGCRKCLLSGLGLSTQ